MHGANGRYMNSNKTVIAIGLMSGTSMDGVDAALVRSDGQAVEPFGPAIDRPYSKEEQKILRTALDAAAKMGKHTPWPEELQLASSVVELAHEEAIHLLLQKAGLKRQDIRVAGFHGQTVLHRPKQGWTVQVGDGGALAKTIGIDVVSRFRQADMEAGGEGAPFAPLYHKALAAHSGLQTPIAVLNLGGVGNVTYIGQNGSLLAFDTGPGNALIDDWMRSRTGAAMDAGGRLAGSGRVNHTDIEALMSHGYFQIEPPKSLDRNDFSSKSLDHLSDADGAATLAAFTVESVRSGLEYLEEAPEDWIVCGGGRKNAEIMRLLARRLPGRVRSCDAIGWRGDFIEAEAFAYLAVRSLRGLPLSLPGTTGVARPVTGGQLHCAE